MKNVYLNSVLISRFYLQTIHITKNTTKIIIIKIKKVKKIKRKENHTFQYVENYNQNNKNTKRNANDLQEEKRRNERSREKTNYGGGADLYCSFTDGNTNG
jgi:hypothetical protein